MPRYEQGIDPTTGLSGLEKFRALKRREILEGANSFATLVKSPYSELECLSWSEQRTQAERVLAGETLPADALLVTLAQANSVDVSDFALRVLANVQRAEAVTKAVVSQQQAYELAVKAATTPEAVTAVVVAYSLPESVR